MRRPARATRPLLATVVVATLLATAGAAAPRGAAAAAEAVPQATVSATPAQTIENFGASGAWWVNDLARFSPQNQRKAAELLFGRDGLWLSAYRYNIGGGGVGVAAGDRAPQTPLVSPGVYDWTRDAGGTAFLRHAASHGVRDIVGFVNSAPAVWKDNGKSCGGNLRPGAEAAFAGYLTDVVRHFAAEGVRIRYLSPMNEPTNSFDGAPCTQEGMLVAVHRRDDIVRALGQELATRSPDTRISADESTSVAHLLLEVPTWMGQPDTARHVANLAHHTYDFPTDDGLSWVPVLAWQLGKPTWATEICCSTGIGAGWGAQYDPTIAGGLSLAGTVHRDLAIAKDSAFHWWTALSKVMGCSPGADPGCATRVNGSGWNDGLIYFDPEYAANGNQNLYPTKRFHALAQYSRFVRPGAVNHDVTGAPAGVQVLATRRAGRWTLVVNNLTTTTQRVDVAVPGIGAGVYARRTSATQDVAPVSTPVATNGTVPLTLPARSITTYVYAG